MVISALKKKYVKRAFDANNKQDLRMYKNFISSRSWGADGCPFELEWPYLNVPDMLAYKIALHTVETV